MAHLHSIQFSSQWLGVSMQWEGLMARLHSIQVSTQWLGVSAYKTGRWGEFSAWVAVLKTVLQVGFSEGFLN